MASGSDSPLVLVTGASGYIATHVIKLLQEEGYKVKGTVRNLEDEKKVKILKELVPDATYPLELVQADLTKDEGWTDAVKDCTYVIHIASPFPNSIPSNEEDLIKPAVDGTKRVLQACVDAGTVKRVVLTSSVVAVHCQPTYEEAKVFTEADWSNLETPNFDAYAKSKTLAEKAAWDFVKELSEEKKIELSVINPGLVLGPLLNNVSGTSVEIIKRLLERSIPMVARVNFSICDVRDVAQAHLKAMTLPEAAGQRHIISTQTAWMKDIALVLAKEFKQHGYSVPTMVAPYFAVWLNSLFDKNSRLVLSRIGKEYKFDNQRMKDVLGIMPRELNDTIIDAAYSLIETGLVKITKKYKQGKKDGVQVVEDKPVNGDLESGKEAEAEVETKEKEETKMEELEPEDKVKAIVNSEPAAEQKQEIEAAEK